MTTREQIRARIDALECLSDVQQAIEDVQDVEWSDGESQQLSIDVKAGRGVTFVVGIPQSVLIAGLRAMERELAAVSAPAGEVA
jgi:hypothetical protein